MPRLDQYQRESDDGLRSKVETLQRSVAALNARLASIDPEAGDVSGVRRKVLELDMRVGAIERGPWTIPPAVPFSD